tara:strand:+ start:1188 stop:1463 length:276 start_codon:yes stop_codon:yes gene_type:complete
MNKYGEITTTGGSGLISLTNVASCYIDAADDVIIDYNNGSKIAIASASALVQADADKVFGVIKSAQQQKWSKVKYTIPALSEDVNAVTFTF